MKFWTQIVAEFSRLPIYSMHGNILYIYVNDSLCANLHIYKIISLNMLRVACSGLLMVASNIIQLKAFSTKQNKRLTL